MEMSQFSFMLKTLKLSRDLTTTPVKRLVTHSVERKMSCPYLFTVKYYRINKWMGFVMSRTFFTIFVSIQMLHFVHGERHKYVDVQIIDDAVPEGAERFQLILSRPSSGLELGTNTTGTEKKLKTTKLRFSELGYSSARIYITYIITHNKLRNHVT